EELFFSQILVYLRKARQRFQKGIPFGIDPALIDTFRRNIDFQLTPSQKKVLQDIFADLVKPYPMHRLLQGDVGCGKTVVAFFVIAAALQSGCQAAFMVPTEVLAQQHVMTFKLWLRGFKVKIALLSSGIDKEIRERIYKELENGGINIVIGTHSLIEERVNFKNLGLVIIDEQHKFGVAQRALLPKKGRKHVPHCLVMSATPIPRSLALSLYGDLDLSVITDLPPERKQPQSICVGERKRKWVYTFLKQRLSEGRQVYIVYPVIEESREWDLKSLKEMYEALGKEFGPYKVGIFHGRMGAGEKEQIMKAFRENKINILIATTVIEVGLNIENATTMVVENPERFGLAQLHQLRGRIRRSHYQPYFVLISKANISENATKRLEAIATMNDGFLISEQDLLIRGPGDFFGNVQSGYPQLKIANPLK
ncbi:unnamed protein product, partial [marine sediment metagenome]